MTVIIVIDPQPIFRLGLIQLLSEGFAKSNIRGEDYTALNKKNNEPESCDFILLTIDSQDTACHYLKQITQVYKPRFILLLNEHPTQPLPNTYYDHPLIKGFISKHASAEIIKASVQLVLAGGTCFPHHSNENTLTLKKDSKVPTVLTAAAAASVANLHPDEAQLLGLTKRQYEVLVLLAEGDPLKTIAKRLDISLATAKSHAETLYQRLNVNSRNAAVYTAVNRGATLGWNHHQPN